MAIYLQISKTDPEMIEIVSSYKGKTILWATVHTDVLGDLGLTKEDLENYDYYLEAATDVDIHGQTFGNLKS